MNAHPNPGPVDGYTDETTEVDGTGIHYVRGGSGPTMVLLHGFPQDWYEWRRIMPRLAERFTVLAVDLPGVGGSVPSPRGWAAADLAGDVHRLVERLGLGPAHLVGHDIGGCVAYAYARRFPVDTTTVTVLEVPVPGVEPELVAEAVPPMWHIPFHMTPGLPEVLVAGREFEYFRYFFDEFTTDRTAIDDADVAHYAGAYRDPDSLRSAFEFYRAMPANAAWNNARTEPVDVPLLLVGGEHLFGPVFDRIAGSLRTNHGWADVRVHVVNGAMHYLVEERPAEVAELIEHHAGGVPAPADREPAGAS